MEAVLTHPPREDLCLDFSNTVDWRNGPKANDSLDSFGSLLKWSVKAGVLGRSDETRLARSADRRVEAMELQRAHELRETIYRIFSAVAHGRSPREGDINLLNRFLALTPVGSKVVKEEAGFAWEWEVDESVEGRVLWPVAKSAADLLTSGELDRVRECANEDEGCGWIFMDRTKSRTRRWCSMSGCGNRAKVRAWYERNGKSPQ